MKTMLLLLGMFGLLGMAWGQVYQTTYASKAYAPTTYAQLRTYPLKAYSPVEDGLTCLTCNDCQVPAAPFNPSFPLLLLSFQAERRSPHQVQLNWDWVSDRKPQTISLYFRKEEAQDFELVQQWTGATPKEFFHANATQGRTYYSLEITANDGKLHRSKVRMVEGVFSKTYLNLFPNPAHEDVFLGLWGEEEGEFRIRLFDFSGRMVHRAQVQLREGQASKLKGIQALSPGIYMLEARGVSGVYRKKLVWRK